MSLLLRCFWKIPIDFCMLNVLVTGASGFVGKHLVQRLSSMANVDSVYQHSPALSDISKEYSLASFLNKKISIVFHLGGKTFVPESWNNPYDYFNTNINGTLNVLEYCRIENARLVYLSSYLYGNSIIPTSEREAVKTNNPYSASKHLAEHLIKKYIDLYGVDATIIRPFNLFGAGQSESFLIPELFRKIKSDQSTIEILDDVPKRDYLHIDDFIDFLVLLISQNLNETFNVGSGESFSVVELALEIMQLLGVKKNIKVIGQSRKNEILETRADISKAKSQLSWTPKLSLMEGLERSMQ